MEVVEDAEVDVAVKNKKPLISYQGFFIEDFLYYSCVLEAVFSVLVVLSVFAAGVLGALTGAAGITVLLELEAFFTIV